jgi:hypothetical protein
MSLKFTVEVDIDKLEQIVLADFEPGGVAQYTWSKIVFDGSVPYMPMITGNFIDRSLMESEPVMDQGELIYPGPFAHYLWEGVLYVDPEYGKGAFFSEEYGFWSRPGVTKVPTNKPLEFTQESNPDAGPRWTERAAADKYPEWEAEMQSHADAGFPMR